MLGLEQIRAKYRVRVAITEQIEKSWLIAEVDAVFELESLLHGPEIWRFISGEMDQFFKRQTLYTPLECYDEWMERKSVLRLQQKYPGDWDAIARELNSRWPRYTQRDVTYCKTMHNVEVSRHPFMMNTTHLLPRENASVDKDSDLWVVKDIVDWKNVNGEVKLLVRWEATDHIHVADETWEPWANFDHIKVTQIYFDSNCRVVQAILREGLRIVAKVLDIRTSKTGREECLVSWKGPWKDGWQPLESLRDQDCLGSFLDDLAARQLCETA